MTKSQDLRQVAYDCIIQKDAFLEGKRFANTSPITKISIQQTFVIKIIFDIIITTAIMVKAFIFYRKYNAIAQLYKGYKNDASGC